MSILKTGSMVSVVATLILSFAGPVQADSRIPLSKAASPFASSSTAVLNPAAANPLTRPEDVPPKQEYETIGRGVASYYGRHLAGNRTASGERFNPDALTAAHRTLPFGTKVQVTNPKNGEAVIVTINDRGPFHGNRLIDLSDAAAAEIGILRQGSGTVELAIQAD